MIQVNRFLTLHYFENNCQSAKYVLKLLTLGLDRQIFSLDSYGSPETGVTKFGP